MARDPYEVLGLDKTASQDDIKKRYRKIAKENHPDLNPGDTAAESRFKEASQAFAVLGDPETRAKYDKGEIDASGQERPEQEFYRQYAETGDGAKYYRHETYGDFDDLGSVFEDLFGARAQSRPGDGAGAGGFRGGGFGGGGYGGGRQGAIRMRGADIHYALDVDFLEAARGGTRRVTMPDGKSLDIKIPPGIADGQQLRLKGKGSPGLGGGERGDALVSISVRPHRHFRRDGKDILLKLPISLREAVLGAKIQVPTIDGPVTLTIPPNSTTGDLLRLKGRGIGRGSGGGTSRGNQLVSLEVTLPKDGDAALEAFLKGNPDAAADDPRAGKGF